LLGQERTRFIRAFHYDVARLIVSKCSIFVMPWLQTSDMIKKAMLAAITRSDCKTMAHLRFLVILFQIFELTPKALLIISGEPGTSKTCSVCCTINSFLGGSKFFFCNDARCGCGNDVSRDGQAAVNNLMAEVLRVHATMCVSERAPRCICVFMRSHALTHAGVRVGRPTSPTAARSSGWSRSAGRR